MMLLETPRLILRTIQDEDLEAFLAYRSDPAVAQYQGWEMPYTREKAEHFIQEMQRAGPVAPGSWLQLAIQRKNTAEMIGDCAFQLLAEAPAQAEIAFTLASASQGYGYAVEAVTRLADYLFRELALYRLRASTDVENLASIRLLERIGMRREAHFIQNYWARDHWASEYWYGLLRSEWLER
jgi:RimJ/RimL family protein N-acetyltransferase